MSDDKSENHDEQGGAPGAGSSPLSAVSALMDERRKYESWLGALEAKRDVTPERVFTRVHADYSTRLDTVLEQLRAHSDGLRAELATLSSKLTEVEGEQQHQRDERAEAELRAHVGELSPDAWTELAAAADRSIDALGARRGELERELTRTRELLTEAERPATPRLPAAAVPAEPAASEPVVAASASVDEPSASEHAHSNGAAAPAGVEAPRDLPELTPAVIAAEARIQEERVAAGTEQNDADVTPPPTQRADTARASGATQGTFDELAFLSSVVDTPTNTPDVPAPTDRGDERARRDSFAQRSAEDDIVNLASGNAMLEGTAPSRSNAPLAANVSGNIPIVIKDKSTEAAKSLKCGECGAMNYPTEWYCERCGAELASL